MNRLKELRNERGLTVRGMQDKININYVTYSRYEAGDRDMSTDVLRKLSDFFEVTIDYMLCHNSYCLYAKYKEGNFFFKIKEDYYKELKEKKYIYFDNNDTRCIDLNSLIGIGTTQNIMALIQEFERMEKIDELFDKKNVKPEDFNALDDDFEEIELTRGLIKRIKDAISEKNQGCN